MTPLTARTGNPSDARDVPVPTPADYAASARMELAAFLQMLERLEPEDWERPTPCSLWDVRDVVAHQAGHIQSGAGLTGMLAQVNPRTIAPYRKRGMSMLDAMNQKQVDMRRDLTTEALIAELREGTPRSIAARLRLNLAAGQVRVPVPPVGLMPVRTLLHRIFPRDMWIHRLDIADATGKPFAITAEHDGRLVALAVQDVAKFVQKRDRELGLTIRLDGPAGGHWSVSAGRGTYVDLKMTVPDFMRRTSGRISAETALERVSSNASSDATRRALDNLLAPY